MRLILRLRPRDFLGPIRVLKYDNSDRAESHTPGRNSMIQTLGLAQSLRKTKIEPTPHAVSEVVEGNANAAGRERVRSPRRTLSIQTMAFAQDDQETGIVPFPQTVNFVQDRDDTVELGRVTSEGRYSVDGSPGFANGPQRTEVKPPLGLQPGCGGRR